MVDKDRLKAFESAVKSLKKKNPDTVWYKNKNSFTASVERTFLPSIDLALGVGGIPRRRIIELFGPEASGKTSLCLHLIGQVQKRGGTVVYVDAENSFDRAWSEKLGVNVDKMVVMQQEDAESVLNSVRTLVQSGGCDLVVVDSVAALVTKTELEGEMGDQQMGVQARLMSKLMRVISVDLLQTETMVVFTNQLRDRMNVRYGNPETTPGGKALKFYASVRMDVRKASDEEAYKNKQHVANVRIAKNKVAPPYGVGQFRIDPLTGILRSHSTIEPAIELGVIKHAKGSTKYEYNGKEWTFETRLIKALDSDPLLMEEITNAVYAKMSEKAQPTPEPEDPGEMPDTDPETEEFEEIEEK